MISFNNTYSSLPSHFYENCFPEKFSSPKIIEVNYDLARELGLCLDGNTDEALALYFSGQSLDEKLPPISTVYAGHQFGHFNPKLGDGRAHLLGEVLTKDLKRYDLMLKGSGRTVFSRNGDGKSAIGPVIREYILSEAMYNLGVKTTRALAACTTGDLVNREKPYPGAVFARIASSHIRVGTFEYFASRNDYESVKTLLDYTINRHFPSILNSENIYTSFLLAVADAQSSLVASWMSLGFIHGVMNTDNMSICGETIDYGPCAFMDHFSSNKVFSSIDLEGRYAYNNQIQIAKWNLFRLAECFIPVISSDPKNAITILEETFSNIDQIYHEKWLNKMRLKFGLTLYKEEDSSLIEIWLEFLEEEQLDFTNSFRDLASLDVNYSKNKKFKNFYRLWQKRIKDESQLNINSKEIMNQNNPYLVPRNHQVQSAIELATEGDFSKFKEMNLALKRPSIEAEEFNKYAQVPSDEEKVVATFCGT